MLTSIFKVVLVMSGVSSFSAGLIFLALRCRSKSGSSCLKYASWYITLIVSLVPLTADISPDARQNLAGLPSYSLSSPTADINYDITSPKQTEGSMPHHSSSPLTLIDVCAVVWMVTACTKALFYVFGYYSFLRQARKKAVFEEKINGVNIYRADILASPIALGILNKKIFLPPDISPGCRELVLKHEFMHFRHFDTFYKLMCVAAKCVHWFNPVMYFVAKSVDEECEFFCDKAVTAKMSAEDKKEYMKIILNLISHSPKYAVTTSMASSKQNIIRRFRAIEHNSNSQNIFYRIGQSALFGLLFAVSIALSAVAGEYVYDGKVPSVSFGFVFENSIPKSPSFVFMNLEDFNNKSLHHSETLPSDTEKAHNDSHPANDTPIYPATTQPNTPLLYDGSDYMPKSQSDADVSVLNEISDAIGSGYVDSESADGSFENEPVATNDTHTSDGDSILDMEQKFCEEDDGRYPYSGSIKYDGLTMDLLRGDLEKSGMNPSTSQSPDLKTDYISDTLSYTNGSVALYSDVSCDASGQVSFYMNSQYDQHIEICFEQDGRQVAGYGIIPDNETTYVFGGFDPEQKYDIKISSSTGSTWKVENNYLVY